MSIIGIIAIAKNYAIGKDGKLPWHHSADLKFFKETTTGHPIVMGHTTWKSIGRPLPNRLNIVLSRTVEIEENENIRLLRNKTEVVDLAANLDNDLFIIGGAKTFQNFADVIDKWIVTEIPESIDGADTFMPADFLDSFELMGEKELSDNLIVKVYERSNHDRTKLR
jgi:dihydrofolate reductase